MFLFPLVALGLAGCDEIGLGLGSKVEGDDFKNLGVYRIIQIDNTLKFGTGFLVNDKNLVITNRHVVESEDGKTEPVIKILVIRRGKVDLVPARVLKKAAGRYGDLALLQPARPLPGPPIALGNYEPASGSDVTAVGFPGAADGLLNNQIGQAIKAEMSHQKFDSDEARRKALGDVFEREITNQFQVNPPYFYPTASRGTVSRNVANESVPVIQHQASINPGNSGGPLLDDCGAAVGINTWFARESQGIFMSVGSEWIGDQIKAAGQEVLTKKRCYFTSSSQLVPYAAIGTAIFLSLVSLLFVFRRSPVIQGPTSTLIRLLRSEKPQDSGSRNTGTKLNAGVTKVAGSASAVRLTPVGTGKPLVIPADRLSSTEGVIVGRDPLSDFVVDEKTVSKRHARILMEHGRFLVEDLGSVNGTWKKGSKITREPFASGETVRFGSAEYKIELPGDPFSAQTSVKDATKVTPIPEISQDRPLLLSGMDGDGHTIQFSLDPGAGEKSWTIGRKSGAVDLLIQNKRVSSVHAKIRHQPGRGFDICDLASSNGTKIDGREVNKDFVGLEGVRKISLGDFDLNVSRG